MKGWLWLAGLLLVLCSPAQTQDVRPALLEFSEALPGLYDFLWKKPSGGETELEIEPVMPAECRLNSGGEPQQAPGVLMVRGRLQCPDGLAGKMLQIRGLAATRTDVLVRVRRLDGHLETYLIRPVNPRITFDDMGLTVQRLLGYARLGIERMLLGVDHLLFVFGLLLIATRHRTLCRTIAAFVVAHSIGLAAATLGYVKVPLLPLNASIGLSILFLGPEIVRCWRSESSFTIRHSWSVAFVFGLLHGFGFAGDLTVRGLPSDELPLVLASFNIGIEIGLLFFVSLILLLQRAFRVLQFRWPWFIALLPAYLVGSVGAYWTLQRTLILLGTLK